MAAGKPAVTVTGAREFRAAMTRMGADLKDMTAIHKRVAEIVADQSRHIVPYLGGALSGSIKSTATRTRGRVQAGSRSVPYAGPIHFGWPARNIKASPFLWDALEDKESEVVDKYEQFVEALVEKVGRETPP